MTMTFNQIYVKYSTANLIQDIFCGNSNTQKVEFNKSLTRKKISEYMLNNHCSAAHNDASDGWKDDKTSHILFLFL